uniref:Glutamate receptor-interacting protein 1 n=1 Tax=Steinernema glaseri TaxID=37863 RepID=A0A1I7YQU2_9BILA
MFRVCFHYTGIAGIASISSISGSLSGVPCGQVCHSETMEVVLQSYAKGNFGFVLHRQPVHGSNTDSAQQPPLFISYIEKGSPADKCGVLQVGDRVLTINDWCTANGSVEEANLVLRHAGTPLTLTVEFDVIESVLPSSGLFTVKLAKRGNNLGITARSETDGQKGEPVIINDIRTGSVAHRCGSIRPGDRILAIDNIPLDTCTVEEAMRLLQRSADIVKLRVKKGNTSEKDDVTTQQTIAYSIELNRKGQPLGLTIASTGEPGDPVIISQLAPGGLAERTGALHAGDRILAINGESIKGKKVTDAMRILQQSTEVVTIKVSRVLDSFVSGYGKSVPFYSQYNQLSIKPYPSSGVVASSAHSDSVSEHSDKMGTPIQSIDSAVDSLDDSPDAAKHASRSSAINPTSAKYVEELNAHVNNSLQDWTTAGDALNNNTSAVSRLPKSALKKTPTRGVALNRPLTTNTNVGSMPPGAVSATSSGGGGDQAGWDSGLSSTTDTNGGANECCSCACQKPGGDDDNWIKILEALETVGEAEMLKKLEESIMCGNVPICKHHSSPSATSTAINTTCTPQGSFFQNNNALVGRAHHPTQPSGLLLNTSTTTNTILKHPNLPTSSTFGLPSYQHHRSERSLSSERADSMSLNSSSEGAGTHFDLPPAMPHPKSAGGSQRLNSLFKQLSGNDPSIPYMTSPVNSGDKPSTSAGDLEPVSLFSGIDHFCSKTKARGTTYRVILTKDPNSGGFGFSVSDGAGENQGVYISAVLPGSPADRCGLIKPMDRILQVNDTSLQYLDCDLAVPLLSTDTVDLLLHRDPTMKMIAEEEELSSCVSSSLNLNAKESAF